MNHLAYSFYAQARANSRKRFWRNVGWMVATAVGSLSLTVFAYYQVTI